MVVHLPSEKSILPYFSGPRGVAISVPFPEVRNRKGAESGLDYPKSMPESLEIFCFLFTPARGPNRECKKTITFFSFSVIQPVGVGFHVSQNSTL